MFLDRDGTLIELVHYLVDPADVKLLHGAAMAINRWKDAGYACVVVTNQSAIGRGMLDEKGLGIIHAELGRQLAESGVTLDGIYHCPVAPIASDPTVVEHSDRKPGPGMLIRASQDLELDLAHSWMIGDTLSDILAGRNAGCKGEILVRTGYGNEVETDKYQINFVVDSIVEAVAVIVNKP